MTSAASDRSEYKVSIVVPALNEADTIGQVLREVAPHGDQVLVIDGNSTDKTRAIAERMGVEVHQDLGRGKGDAIRKGLEVADHPIVVFIDADGSHEPDDIPALVAPIRADEADIVVGSRMAGGSDELFSDVGEFIRVSGSMVINLGINYRWDVRLSDTQNGFRAVLGEVARELRLKAHCTSVEQEMVMKALRMGYRIMNVPSHEYARKGGQSKVRVRKVWHRYVWNAVKNIAAPSGDRLKRTARR